VAANLIQLVARYLKQADLNPALGHPGGSCYLQRRVRETVRNQKVQDYLVRQYQNGQKWKRNEEEAVYKDDYSIGKAGASFPDILLRSHAQHRMDLRGVTVKDIKKAFYDWNEEMADARVRGRGETLFQRRLQDSMRTPGGTWFDAKNGLRLSLRLLRIGEVRKGKRQIPTFKVRVETAVWPGLRTPDPIPEDECSHAAGLPEAEWSREYPAHGIDRILPKRVAARYAALRQDPIPGYQTYVSQKSWEGQSTDTDQESPSALPLPGSATPGGAGRVIPQFSYNGPGPDSDIKPRTLGLPGEQYGNPSNNTYQTVDRRIIESSQDDEDESMDKQAYRPKWRPGKYQRKSRGRTKHKRQMNYRRNKAKNKMKAKRWRKINSRKPAYKQWQKRRRSMNRKRRVASTLRVVSAYMQRMGSVLTVPDIAFQIGPEMLGGYVHSVSPMSGMVTIELDETNVSQLDSLPVELFLRMAVFSSDEDIDAFFNLVDVEIGPEAYADLDESLVRECARRYDRDPDADSFKEDCFGVSGEYDLGSMGADQMESVVKMVLDGYMQSGDARDFTMGLAGDERSQKDADNPEIPEDYDPGLYYGEVKRG